MKTYTFRSILTENVERVIPGTVFSRMELQFREETSAKHTIELSTRDILTDRAWRTGLFISLMVCFGVFGIIYGLMLVVMKKTLAGDSGAMIRAIYFAAAFITCAVLWFIITLKTGLRNKKRDTVEKERGKGNWRIVDEEEWEKFIRLLNAAKKKREELYNSSPSLPGSPRR